MSWHVVAKVAVSVAKRKLAEKAAERSMNLGLKRVIIGVGIVSVPAALILLVLALGLAAVVAGGPAAAAGGALGIRPVMFSAYVAAESNAPSVAEGCVVDWPIIAGIWKVESNHATYRGRTVTPDGIVTPPLYGITLDGSEPDTATVPDTDDGLLDGDPTWDRAVGPAQFLPGSWRAFGQDGNADGTKDPQNVFDAALATVAHLCLTAPGDYTNPDDLAGALLRYNNSAEYVATVAGWIDYYRSFQFTGGVVLANGLYAFPLPVSTVTVDEIRRSHHDYPASDLGVPEGTPVYAAHPGTVSNVYEPCSSCKCGWGVTITGLDSHRYTYCHGTQVNIEPGAEVTPGQLIMTSGNTGNSEAPHLHLQIRNPDGALICPQPLLEAWWNGIGLNPATAPTSGCTH
ncbi:MAG: peptidoglycan DD-metalloendopeptidase family protein [Acidimicrobiia bacterium]|nr:peptidoglycan DD-metalloendopeptidase family protein [Acidimicrobiia bacterium]